MCRALESAWSVADFALYLFTKYDTKRRAEEIAPDRATARTLSCLRPAGMLLYCTNAVLAIATASNVHAAVARHCAIRCVSTSLADELREGDELQLPDANVHRLPDGSFYNHRLGALNVFEIDVDESIIDEAAEIFYGSDADLQDGSRTDGIRGSPFHSISNMAEPYEDVSTPAGRFFAQRVSWHSNIAWVSVDDAQVFGRYERLFERLDLPARFAPVIPHASRLRLYSAFYVVRSWCEAHNFHTDYMRPVGTHAMTLITPLRNFRETDSFQLVYKSAATAGANDGGEVDRAGAPTPVLKRYTYSRGKAIVFSSRFEHSTEPGAGDDGEVHACAF